ncbi:MAG: hypothetical protein HC812_06065 [Leptolyngbya sp. RL_3_1]|nr:hypothetical protein [Leptolyngbya sp. RL_3_1]
MTSVFSKFKGLWAATRRHPQKPVPPAPMVVGHPADAAVAARSSASAKPPRPKRPLYYRPLFWLVLLTGALTAGGATRFYRIWMTTKAQLPDVSTLLSYERGGTITIQADDGQVLQKLVRPPETN